MFAETTAEVIFAGVDDVAVRVDTTAPSEVECAAQVRLLILFAAHIYADLGTHEQFVAVSANLASMDAETATA